MKVCFGEGSSTAGAVLAHLPPGVVEDAPLDQAEVWVAGAPDAAGLGDAPHLKTVVIPWAGLSERARQGLMEHPHIAVYTLHGNAAATAELALAHLLSCARGLAYQTALMRDGDWSLRWTEEPLQLKLAGAKVCVLGWGEIGRRIGRVCKALDIDVAAVRRTPGTTEENGCRVGGPETLAAAASGSQALICALPGSPETAGLVGGAVLDLLAPDPIIVNIGRGSVFDVEALAESVQSGHIRRLGLDVWWSYPRPDAGRHFGGPEEMVIKAELGSFSPHAASHVINGEAERAKWLAEALAQLARGQEPAGRTWPARGY